MNHCKNLYYLSSIVCMLTDHFTEDELELLSADLLTLGEMIDSALIHRKHCMKVCHHDLVD